MTTVWHVFGNSPSLLDEVGLEDLHPSIGVNRILRLLEPDYVLIVDGDVATKELPRLRLYSGTILTYHGMREWFKEYGLRAIVFPLGPHHVMKQRLEGPYGRAGNTGIYAIEFAARKLKPLGGGEIHLHGMDFRNRKPGVTHFFGDGSKEGCRKENWGNHLRYLKKSVAICNTHGIQIVNASPWKGPLDAFMERLDARTR